MENPQPIQTPTIPEQQTVKANHMMPMIVGLVVLLIGVAAVAGYFVGANTQKAVEVIPPNIDRPFVTEAISESVLCTKETKMCPDGSSVVRTGSNCEFAECQQSTELTQIKEVYSGRLNPFTLSYPPTYVPEASDVPNGGTITEQVGFTNNDSTSPITSFVVRINPGISELPEFPYDQPPTGEYELDGVKGIYLTLPEGYGDGGKWVPRPETYVFFIKDNKQYQFSFYGVSDIQHPEVQEILKGFSFTN